jgi:hypothetical protein
MTSYRKITLLHTNLTYENLRSITHTYREIRIVN